MSCNKKGFSGQNYGRTRLNDVIALIGNPNCGKTTLFNSLTGTYQKVGNWSGVTTEKKEGVYVKDKRVKIIDLPGLYSLDANSLDERVVIEYLRKTPPKVIINVIDGTNLERNLYLTTELCALNIPMIIAVNFSDQLENNGIKLDTTKLTSIFSAPVIAISALKGLNVDKLMVESINCCQKANLPEFMRLKAVDTVEKRYSFIEKVVKSVISRKKTRAERFTDRADRILLNKYVGIPIFFLIMTMVYFLSIRIGGFFGQKIIVFFNSIERNLFKFLTNKGCSQWIVSLSAEGIVNAIGTVAGFLPQILILFALLTVLEECGYAAREAFLLDRIFRSFGLSGKSFIPMMLGCGCTVTGIMSTRTIEDTGERTMTVFLTPFMPCGAKTAVFGWFSSVLFGGSAIIATAMYFLGIVAVIVFGWILKRFKWFSAKNSVFTLEIPMLRFPSIKDVLYVLLEKTKDFVMKAGLIVFVFSVALWALRNLGVSGYTNGNVEQSFLYSIGNLIKPVFYPLGFDGWQASVAILSGVFAKEAVIETFELLAVDITKVFINPWSVYSFTAFILLSPPCAASIAAAYRELNDLKKITVMIIFQTFAGYLVALIINLIGILFSRSSGLILSVIIAIIILLALIFAVKRLKKTPCNGCNRCCKNGDNKCKEQGKPFTT